jgi:signal transduction histidine kinase
MVTAKVTQPALRDRVGPPAAGVMEATEAQLPPSPEPDAIDTGELDRVAAATRPRRAIWAVPMLTTAMLVAAVLLALFAIPDTPPVGATWDLKWWMLAAGFLVGESLIIHIPVQRDSHTISMSEIPLVLGLAMASPLALIHGRLLATAVVLLGRRQPLLKLTFNLSLFLLETTIAPAIYRVILGNDSPASPKSWLATTVAVGIAVIIAAGLVDVVIGLNDRRRKITEIVRSFATGSLISMSVAILGILAVIVLEHEPRAGTLLIGATLLLFILFKIYGSLSKRHDDLSSLYRFTNQVDGTLGSRDIAVVTLREAVSILRAQRGEIILSTSTDSHASYLGFSVGERPAQKSIPVSEIAELLTIALGDKADRLFGPTTRDSRLRMALGGQPSCGMISPVAHGDGSLGVLVVTGKSGVTKHFEPDELELLDTIANHASLTLERARVIERLQNEIAEKMSVIRSKDQLIAAVSHEFRTPLTGVLGFAEILQESHNDIDDGEVATMLSAITDNAIDLSHIVEDLLTAARAQMGSLTIVPSPVAVRPLVSRVVEQTAGSAHHIVVSGDNAVVLADESRVRQILRNLISNAQRYGGHRIHVATRAADGYAHLRVSDNGDGIPESDQERIFAPYESAHDSGTQPGSLGLGLAISRSLARLMEGDLSYQRNDGWTTFDLALPLQPSAPAGGTARIEMRQI